MRAVIKPKSLNSRGEFGSYREDRRRKNLAEKRGEYALNRVSVLYGSETLEEYRKYRPHYARMLERGTAIVRRCVDCNKAFVIMRAKNGGKCWPCFSKTKSDFPKKLQDSIFPDQFAVIRFLRGSHLELFYVYRVFSLFDYSHKNLVRQELPPYYS